MIQAPPAIESPAARYQGLVHSHPLDSLLLYHQRRFVFVLIMLRSMCRRIGVRGHAVCSNCVYVTSDFKKRRLQRWPCSFDEPPVASQVMK